MEEEIQDYESAFTGEQIDEAVRLMLGIRTGSVEVVPQIDGDGYALFDLPDVTANARIFTAARCPGKSFSRIAATVTYDAATGSAVAWLWGDDVMEGFTYVLDWLMVPSV